MNDEVPADDRLYAERTVSVLVPCSSRREQPRIFRRVFEGGRRETRGLAAAFSGPPPPGWHVSLGVPTIERPADLVAAVTRFGRELSRPFQLLYSHSVCFRISIDERPPRQQVRSVWSLTGTVLAYSGKTLPIGLSGRGDGLGSLESGRLAGDVGRQLSMLDRAEAIGSQTTRVVLSPLAAATLVHESVGHFVEASADPSVDLGHRLGCRIASELLTCIDDPCAVDGSARYDLDDDGVEVHGSTQVVHEGVVTAQLHSLASARAAQCVSTGNGRSAGAWEAPLPRLSNLVCRAGRSSEEGLIENLHTGLYLHRLTNGFSRGTRVSAGVLLAESIERGKRTRRYLTGGSIEERVDVLTRLVELSDHSRFSPNSLCGKGGQLLADVGTCSPAMRISALAIRG
jgi:TldD protein